MFMALIAAGADAPEFNIPNQDGKTVKKDDFAGRYVLLWWFPKADTPGWTIEGNGFRDRIQDFEDRNASIVGVSYDSPTDNGAFRDKFSFPYDLLSDEEGVMSIAFGVSEPDSARSPRKSVLIGPDGKVVITYDKVTPADHPGLVIDDLDGMS
jgi:peroxiredoxin Q/BCP